MKTLVEINYKDEGENKEFILEVPKHLEELEIVYDKGRFSLLVNGKLLYESQTVGDDFEISIK